ncbi:response regulator transcription factor [Glycomyces terrestris]|uniref:DNA-binding response regulator n=1 Tax=Glycomyces terrestris TaxID=2493553 RepID=A0A426UW58_9ACTN|nr:response regulator transcription factor [Glycomyces terrestris]RRR98554.1 DNA-binding response regulator [Glycomyces terrestris]
MIRVLLKHDQDLWRTALARGLGGVQEITEVHDLSPGEDVIAAARQVRPHVLVHEAGLLPHEHVASVCSALPDANVLLLMDPNRPADIRPEVTRFAPRVGIMTTGDSFDRFVEAIRRLMRGEPVIDAEIALAAMRSRANPLTPREREVLGLAATGARTVEIAEKLFLRVGTVQNYLSNAIHKLGARSRIDAVRIAQGAGWI